MNNNNSKPYYDDAFDLRQVFRLFKERNQFIFKFTGVLTLIVILYVLLFNSSSKQYKVQTSFIKPTINSVNKIMPSCKNDQSELISKDDKIIRGCSATDVIFAKLLTSLSSRLLQREVFIEGGYAEKLGNEGNLIVDVEKYITKFVDSITITHNKNKLKYELPHVISIQGSNPEILSEFIDEAIIKANKETVNYFFRLQNIEIERRIKEIDVEIGLLIEKNVNERNSKIERIIENDKEQIRTFNKKIDIARYKAKMERLNQISTLTDAAKLASSLGIIDNNLKQIYETENIDMTIVIKDSNKIPEWYLYGEKALLERIKILQNRTSDDPFIPELVDFNIEIDNATNNIQLATLKERLNDAPFIPEINELNYERNKLKGLSTDITGINAMQLYQPTSSKRIPSKNLLLIVMTSIISFLLSLCIVIMMNYLKEEDVTNIQKIK